MGQREHIRAKGARAKRALVPALGVRGGVARPHRSAPALPLPPLGYVTSRQRPSGGRSTDTPSVRAAAAAGELSACGAVGLSVLEMSTNTTTLLFERFHPPREQLRSCWTRSQGQSSGVRYLVVSVRWVAGMTQGLCWCHAVYSLSTWCVVDILRLFREQEFWGRNRSCASGSAWARRFRASFFAWALRLARIFFFLLILEGFFAVYKKCSVNKIEICWQL
jgi:hypothetical protein